MFRCYCRVVVCSGHFYCCVCHCCVTNADTVVVSTSMRIGSIASIIMFRFSQY